MARLRYLTNARTGAKGTVSKEPLRFGTSSVPLTLTPSYPKLQVYTTNADEDALSYGSYIPMRSVVILDATQDEGIALRSIQGMIKVEADVDLTISPNFWNAINGIDGYLQFLGETTIGAHTRLACVHATMQITDDITVTSGGRLAGFFAEMSSITDKTATDPYPVAFLADKLDSLHVASQEPWKVGLFIPNGACTTPIQIGTETTPTATAVNGSSAVKIYSDFSNETALNYHVPVWVTGRYIADGAYTASVYTLRGHVEVEGTLTSASGQQYIMGVHGRAIVTGAIVNGGAMVMGVKAEILNGGATTTTVSHMACLWADWQNKDTVTGETDILYLTNNSDKTMDNAIFIYGHQVTNFVNFDATSKQGGMVTTGATHTATVTCDAKIKIKIGDDTFYIPAYGGTISLD